MKMSPMRTALMLAVLVWLAACAPRSQIVDLANAFFDAGWDCRDLGRSLEDCRKRYRDLLQ